MSITCYNFITNHIFIWINNHSIADIAADICTEECVASVGGIPLLLANT
jgi:hypothetical protein